MSAAAKPRVLIYVRAISGGAGKNAVIYANILAAAGHEVELCCGTAPAQAQFPVDAAVTLRVFGRRRSLAAVPHLRRRLAGFAPAICLVVDATNLPAMLLALPACPARPQLILREALSTRQRADMRGPVMRAVKRVIHRIGYRRCDRVIALTREMRDELLGYWGLPADKVVQIPNGVAVAPLPPNQPQIRRRAGGIICVARLEAQKDVATLLRAFALLRRDTDCHLAVAGSGRLLDALRSQARLLKIEDHVDFLGHVAETAPLYAAAQLCVLPSRWEGFPNVVIEALAQGTPVVATATPGAVEILQDRDAGLLCRIGDAEDMAAKIAEALSVAYDPENLRRLAETFSDEKLEQRVLSLISGIRSDLPA